MKKHIPLIILIVVFFAGLSLLLYPTISNLVNQLNQSRAVAGYRDAVSGMNEEIYSKAFEDAHAYNKNHTENIFSSTFQPPEEYETLLNINDTQLMCYVDIPKIDIKLGVYHGTDESVLRQGMGHLPGTSLPVGGVGTHAVLSGHTGLPSAKLLSDLDQLKIGDIFRIYVLNEVLEYRIDKISIVEPTEVEELEIVRDMDYLTLLTCTPYGVNSHRLLVRGVAAEKATVQTEFTLNAEAILIDSAVVASIITAPIIVLVLFILIIKYRKQSMMRQAKRKG